MDALKFGRVTADGQLILTGEPGETTAVEDAEGFFLQPPRTVFLAIDRANDSAKDESPEAREAALSEVLDHEIVHALRNLDLWTDAEWSLLERAAKTRVYLARAMKHFLTTPKEDTSICLPLVRWRRP